MSEEQRKIVFGFQDEWQNFEERNPLFLERFPNLKKAFVIAFGRTASLGEPIDKFVFMYGRLCVEDFFEILLCAGNGAGQAAQRLLRGLYERAVTLRYLHEHPSEIDDFLDFHWVAQRKLMIACENTMGEGTFPPEMRANIQDQYERVKERFMVTDCAKCGTKRANHTWSKLDFATMASRIPLGKLIVPGYFIPLRQAHATVAAMTSRMAAGENEGISFVDAAQRKEADNALRVSHNISLDVLRVHDERFSVPSLKEQYEVCLQDFVDVWQRAAGGRAPTSG